MRRGPNTRQKKATTRRLAAQRSLGLPIVSKLVILASGLLKHPTKKRPTVKGIEVRQAPNPARRWQDLEKMQLLRLMTSWQSTQWARAGYPGLDAKGHVSDAEVLQKFIDMKHPNQVKREQREKQNV